jgi:hypothetical protein
MTDEQKLEPDEQEDVEAHSALQSEPFLEPERADDEDDEVEGHAAFPAAKPEL